MEIWKIEKVTIHMFDKYEKGGTYEFMLIETERVSNITGEVKTLFRMSEGRPFPIVGDFEIEGGYETLRQYFIDHGYHGSGCYPTEIID